MATNEKPEIPRKVRKALEEALDYSWDDELEYYANLTPEQRSLPGIFRNLVVVANWLDGTNHTAEEFCRLEGHELDKAVA